MKKEISVTRIIKPLGNYNNNDLENELIEPKIIKNKIDDELIDIHENQRKAEKLLSNNQKHNNNIDEILKNISKI